MRVQRKEIMGTHSMFSPVARGVKHTKTFEKFCLAEGSICGLMAPVEEEHGKANLLTRSCKHVANEMAPSGVDYAENIGGSNGSFRVPGLLRRLWRQNMEQGGVPLRQTYATKFLAAHTLVLTVYDFFLTIAVYL